MRLQQQAVLLILPAQADQHTVFAGQLRRISKCFKPRHDMLRRLPRHAAGAVDGKQILRFFQNKRTVFIQIHFRFLLILKGARLRLCPNHFSPSLCL